MRPESQSRPSAWCQEVVWFRNACSFTVVLEHDLEHRNLEVLFGIFLNDEENDSLALQI